jgi:hypothetical protein
LYLHDKDLENLEQLINQLHQEQDRKNPRFGRLGKVLSRRLPEAGFWHNDPANELTSYTLSVWQPRIKDSRQIRKLLKVLLPLARNLGLHVFDAFQRICLPCYDGRYINGYVSAPWEPFPLDKGIAFRQEYDPDASKESLQRFTEKAYSKIFEKRLTATLGEYGFNQDLDSHMLVFERRSGTDESYLLQRIETDPSVRSLRCFTYLEVFSTRLCDILTRWLKKGFGTPKHPNYRPSTHEEVFRASLWSLRKMAEPDWVEPEMRYISKLEPRIETEEEADWLVEDLLQYGLSLLDGAWTVERVDWLYNQNPETARYFRDAALHDNPKRLLRNACIATIYARLAGNPDFEDIVRDFGQRIELRPYFSNRPKSSGRGVQPDENGRPYSYTAIAWDNTDVGEICVTTSVNYEGKITSVCHHIDANGEWFPADFLPNWTSAQYALLVDLCRTDLQPVSCDELA